MTTGNDAAQPLLGAPVGATTRRPATTGTVAIWTTAATSFSWAAADSYYLVTGEPSAGTPYLIAMIAALVSWISLSEWMSTIADSRRKSGATLPSNGWIWFSWFIPIAFLFSPAKTMWKLARRSVGLPLLLAWWLPWLVATQVTWDGDSDRDPSAMAVEAIAILFSWLALQAIIRRISDDSVT